MRGASTSCLCGYAHTWAALDSSLHGTLSTVVNWPKKWPARGPRRRVPDAGISAGAGTAIAEQQVALTRCYMARGNDVTASRCAHIGGSTMVRRW
jgi:hypothetical protein